MAPGTPLSSSCNSDIGFSGGSRRSSKDSSADPVPGVTLNDLVDQLTIPDYFNSFEQIAKTKIFLMIYRKFLRPRELLEMFIERFEDLGESVDGDDEGAKDTRLRICACLYYWLKHHPNDLIHRQTRQRVATFLKERVALFPCLNEIYVKLLPMSSIHYFNSWRWSQHYHQQAQQGDPSSGSRSSSIFGPPPVATASSSLEEDLDFDFYDIPGGSSEQDEDREWGLCDEVDVLPEAKKSLSMDSLTPFPSAVNAAGIGNTTGGGISNISHQSRVASRTFLPQLSRDRRSSTGSLALTSPCAMEEFVANRRGSASSISSGVTHSSPLNPSYVPPTNFVEGDLTYQQQPQPMISIPFIGRRNSSQVYRQKHQQSMSPGVPMHQAGMNATMAFRETFEEAPVHPLQCGRVSPLPPHAEYLSMNTPFIEIKDAAIAEQLTCVEFGLFKKLKPRDMLRQVWKTSKGSSSFQACIAHFNFISSWVGTMILSSPKAKYRAKMMEKFINIAKILRDMGNFNTMMAIIGAMNTSSIHRLVQTRELLQGKEVWNTFKELEHLMSSERSFFEYRQALKTQKLPCIPYLGVHLADLLSISEGNRDLRPDGTVHWQKICLLTEVISTVMQFQSTPYMIQPDPFISRMITDTHVLDDEQLYTKSVGAEPSKLQHSRSLSKPILIQQLMTILRRRTEESDGQTHTDGTGASYASVVAHGNTSTKGNNNSAAAPKTHQHEPSSSNDEPPLMYKAIRFFFKMCLHSFYAHVEVEGTENIAPDNYPAILVANHSNSLTDAIAVLATVPPQSRSMIRLTAKDTFWHQPGVFNSVIKSAGTLPIKRRKDYDNQKVDNTETLNILIDSIGTGSCTLSKYQDIPDFSLTLMTASINYLHREKFRSDVVVTFHTPIVLTPQQDQKLFSSNQTEKNEAIRKLTELMENTVRATLLDAQDWQTVRVGHTARKLYAGDLGTRISLGQYMRLTRKFVAAFGQHKRESAEPGTVIEKDGETVVNGQKYTNDDSLDMKQPTEMDAEIAKKIDKLASDLSDYQDQLDFFHLKDYRIQQGKPSSKVIIAKLFQRFLLACLLSTICIPGLILWAPVFLAVKIQEKRLREKGPLEDILDEIAQYKLMIATLFLPIIWGVCVMLTLPIAFITGPGIVVLMWLTIRWLEDLIHNAKSMLSLLRLLYICPETMESLRECRQELAVRVHEFAVQLLRLPEDPEELVRENKTHLANSGWIGRLSGSYFSIKRRRRKDWNEVMRLHDVTNFD
ncbi:hypothetical protein BGZ65_011042 [Modicella reniformis]|uniref:Uncharacterized protein n=1 Tax=Modicella reniformis TaxID=1440133 RepID=A0A9P6MK33_9FUNG|nr:hypothetical protein BGZ65_011042 [Modicella reniformis]